MISFADMAAHFRRSAERCEAGLELVVVQTTAGARERAAAMIGHDQPGWRDLSPATLYGFVHPLAGWIPGKITLGYASEAEHRPLERTGALARSIEGTAEGLLGVIGSADPVALYQEMGTPNARYPIPPRPFLATGLRDEMPQMEVRCGELALSLLVPPGAR